MYQVALKKDRNRTDINAYQVTTTDPVTGEVEVMDVHTNQGGDGLWINGQQIEGTCQFAFVGPHSYRSYFQRRYSDC
jgi:hypothetical protein